MKKNKLLSAVIAALTLTAGVSVTPTVIAQDQESSPVIEEMIVTARKKEETLLEIPLSVTAITNADIEAAGFDNIKDLAKVTPGFVFEGFDTTPGRFDSVPFVRGVTFDNPSPIRQPVSVFIDGVYVAGGTQGIGLEDVERVEVIKGPQSAQFGRSTYSGAINYITADPSEEFGGKVSALAATHHQYEVKGSLEGQLAEGLTARLSGRISDKQGHYDNSEQISQRLGDEETSSIGLTLVFEPNDAFKARLRTFNSKIDDGPAASTLLDASFGRFATPAASRPYLTGEIPSIPNSAIGQNSTDADFATFIASAEAVAANGNPVFPLSGLPSRFGVESDSSRLTLDFSYDFGAAVLSGNFGTNSEDGSALYDFDQTARRTFLLATEREFEDNSAELRLSGLALDDRLDWSVGVSKLEIDFNNTGSFGGGGGLGGSGMVPQLRVISTDGFFGQVGYAVTDRLNVNLELRDQEDTIDLRQSGQPDVTQREATFDSTLPRLTVDFKATDDSLLYFNYSEGNLPGGFNPNFLNLSAPEQAEARVLFPSASGTFLEESIKSYEFGLKQSLLDGRASFTLAAYRFDRTDQLSTVLISTTNPDFDINDPANNNEFNTTTLQVNAAATDISGLEFEGDYIANDNWSFGGTFAYTKAEVSEFPASGNAGDYQLAFGTSDGFIGTTAPRYPEIQASLSASYTQPTTLFGADTFYARSDLFYADEYFLSTANLGIAPSATELNIRAGLRNDKWSLEAFVTNLTKEDAPSAANNTASQNPGGVALDNRPITGFFTEATAIGLRDKLQAGIRVGYNF